MKAMRVDEVRETADEVKFLPDPGCARAVGLYFDTKNPLSADGAGERVKRRSAAPDARPGYARRKYCVRCFQPRSALGASLADDIIENGTKGIALSESGPILDLRFRYEMPELFSRLVEEFQLIPEGISKHRLAAAALVVAAPAELRSQ